MTSTVGDFSISSSFIFMNNLFCCFSIWILDWLSAAALDWARNVSLELCLSFRFSVFFCCVFFGGIICLLRLRGDTCFLLWGCPGCCFLTFTSRLWLVLRFCCCARWFFLAMDTIFWWLYKLSSPSGVLDSEKLVPWSNCCFFGFACLFSSKQNCFIFSLLLLYSLSELHATIWISLFGGGGCFCCGGSGWVTIARSFVLMTVFFLLLVSSVIVPAYRLVRKIHWWIGMFWFPYLQVC